MAYDLDSPAQLMLGSETLAEPQSWDDAEHFATLREALEAAVDRMGQHPWIRTGGQVIAPHDVDDLWKEAFRGRSD